LGKALSKGPAKSSIFGEEQFRYDAAKDAYLCPAGQEMKRSKSLAANLGHWMLSFWLFLLIRFSANSLTVLTILYDNCFDAVA
jgi:hypothetical protein